MYLLYASLMLSCMPCVHFHSFVALVIVAGFLFCIQYLGDLGYWSVIRDWLFFRGSTHYSCAAASALDFAGACGALPATAMGLDEQQRASVVILAEEPKPTLAGVRLACWMAKPKLKTFYWRSLAFCRKQHSRFPTERLGQHQAVRLVAPAQLCSCRLFSGTALAALFLARSFSRGAVVCPDDSHGRGISKSRAAFELADVFREDLQLADFVRAHTAKTPSS